MSQINLDELERDGRIGPLLRANAEEPARAGTARADEVLVVGVAEWAVREAAAQLTAAGRKVHRCSESTEVPFPCNALMAGRGCPLDKHPVDVVLDVHSGSRPKLQLSEMGVICGLRDRLPLVVGGLSDMSILAPWAEQVPAAGDIVSTCDTAVAKRATLTATEKS